MRRATGRLPGWSAIEAGAGRARRVSPVRRSSKPRPRPRDRGGRSGGRRVAISGCGRPPYDTGRRAAGHRPSGKAFAPRPAAGARHPRQGSRGGGWAGLFDGRNGGCARRWRGRRSSERRRAGCMLFPQQRRRGFSWRVIGRFPSWGRTAPRMVPNTLLPAFSCQRGRAEGELVSSAAGRGHGAILGDHRLKADDDGTGGDAGGGR